MTKRILALFIAVLMLLSFASCMGDGTGEKTTEAPSTTSYIREIKTNVAAVKDVTGIGLAKLARDRDYAYNVSYFDDVQQVKDMIRNGKADFAAMNLADAVELYNEGADIKIVAVNNLASMFVLAKGTTVNGVSGLKNKTIYALEPDLLTESYLKSVLSDNGVEYENLNIRFFGDISEIAAEIEGKSEYVLMLPGVEAAKLPEDEERIVAVDMIVGWINQRNSLPVHGVVVARADYIASNPEIADEFRLFNEVSVNFVLGNAETAAILLGDMGFFDSVDTSLSYILTYCSLGYTENEKMKKIIEESLDICIEGELPANDFYLF